MKTACYKRTPGVVELSLPPQWGQRAVNGVHSRDIMYLLLYTLASDQEVYHYMLVYFSYGSYQYVFSAIVQLLFQPCNYHT